MSAVPEKPPNTRLELTNPDAAQSVCRPLCLLSGLAAQARVRGTGRQEDSSATRFPGPGT